MAFERLFEANAGNGGRHGGNLENRSPEHLIEIVLNPLAVVNAENGGKSHVFCTAQVGTDGLGQLPACRFNLKAPGDVFGIFGPQPVLPGQLDGPGPQFRP